MPTPVNKSVIDAIAALKKYKATHSFIEISQLTGIKKSCLINSYYRHFDPLIPFTKEAKQRIIAKQLHPAKHSIKINEQVIELIKSMSVLQVASELSISKNSVYKILKAHNILPPRYNMNRKEFKSDLTLKSIEAIKQYKSDYTYEEISEMTDLPVYILKHARRYIKEKIKPSNELKLRIAKQQMRADKLTNEKIAEIIEIKKNNREFSVRKIAEIAGVSETSAKRYLRRAGFFVGRILKKKVETQVVKKAVKKVDVFETQVEDIENTPHVRDKLFNKYKDKVTITPLFLIREHGITPKLAGEICRKIGAHHE